MNSALGRKAPVEAIPSIVKPPLLAVLGRRLIKLLKWCVIAFVLAFGFTLAALHVVARTSYISAQTSCGSARLAMTWR